MKGLIWGISFVFVSLGGVLAYLAITPDPILQTVPVAMQIQTRQEEAGETIVHKVDSKTRQRETGACLLWGPFTGMTMQGLEQALRENHLNDKAQVTDRFLPQRYLVYLGPLENMTAVRAFSKQFKQQGFSKALPITRGNLSPGIQIGEFATEAEALAYIRSGKVPRVQGIRVVNRLGEPSEEVDLMFKDLTPEQAQRLQRLVPRFARTKLVSCERSSEQKPQ